MLRGVAPKHTVLALGASVSTGLIRDPSGAENRFLSVTWSLVFLIHYDVKEAS